MRDFNWNGLKRILSGLAGLSALSLAFRLIDGFDAWRFDVITLSWVGVPVAAAALLLWFALRESSADETELIWWGWKGGIIGVLVGFTLGFIIVPMIASVVTGRDSPQGPLLGIFVTGPAGFPMGAVTGILIKIYKRSRS
jgi:hypothetical protein